VRTGFSTTGHVPVRWRDLSQEPSRLGRPDRGRTAPSEQSRRGRLRCPPECHQRPSERDSWHGRPGGPQRLLLSPPWRRRATDRGVSRRASILRPRVVGR